MPVTLDDDTVDRVARRILELQQLLAPSPVLSRDEAVEFVRVGSVSALDRWCAKWAANCRCGNGRYTRAALKAGLDKEARTLVPRKRRAA